MLTTEELQLLLDLLLEKHNEDATAVKLQAKLRILLEASKHYTVEDRR